MYLREQLDCVINQSYPLQEVIIQDDGSTDDTLAVVKEYAERFPFIKCHTNTGEHGVNPNYFSA